MLARLSRLVLFGAYQLSIAIGIVLLPVALVARRLGIPIPMHRAIAALGAAYERTDDAA